MRHRMIVFGLVVILVVGGTLLAARRGGDTRNGTAASPEVTATAGHVEAGLGTRIATAGAVDVAIAPIRIDASGAAFKVSLDTHSEELTVELQREAALVVDGVEWPVVSWSGDPPGGHHRVGELRFESAGTASGEATLTIGGFSEPIEASWTLGS